MNTRLLNALACPVCHGKLDYQEDAQQFICHHDQLAFPIVDQIPVLLESHAIALKPASENERNHA